jgi:hypothetical protein
MWLLRFVITMRNRKGLIRRGEIRTNSRCWPKPFGKTPQFPTHKARENPEHLLAHVFSVALRDTGPVPAPPPLKAGGLDPLNVPPP